LHARLVAATAHTVSRIQTLREAAQLMVERGASHLIVLDDASGQPVGVLSTTDILQAYAAPLPLSTRSHP